MLSRFCLSNKCLKVLGSRKAKYPNVTKFAIESFEWYSPFSPRLLRMMSSKPKILVTRPDLPESALKILQNYDLDVWNEDSSMPREVLLKRIAGKDAALITPADRINDEFLDAAGPQLKVIATITVGYDHVDFPAVKRRGIRFGNTPGVLDDAVAELTIGVMLTCTRRLFEGRDAILRGQWPKYVPLFWLNGVGLKDSVVGIIGLGRIGVEIARRLVPFKVKQILYTSRREKSEAREFNGKKVELNELLQSSDIVIVMCVLCDETRHLLGEEKFKLMKRSAILVNASRGDVIEQESLIRALKNGTIAGAALDVMTPEPLPADHELLKLKNCCFIPHLGSSVIETSVAMANLSAENIIAGLSGKLMPAEVV